MGVLGVVSVGGAGHGAEAVMLGMGSDVWLVTDVRIGESGLGV